MWNPEGTNGHVVLLVDSVRKIAKAFNALQRIEKMQNGGKTNGYAKKDI